MVDIFDEVDEDLRAEKAQAFLRRYGGVLLVAMGLTLVGVGAYQYWHERQIAARDAVASRFLAAQDEAAKDPKAARATFADLADTAPAGYRLLAKLHLAALEWDQGQHDSAIAEWRAVADSTDAPQILRDLATLTLVNHELDTGDAKALKDMLQPMLQTPSRLKPLAEQTSALLDLRLNRAQEARGVFKSLAADPQTPQGLRQVSRDILTTLGEEGSGPHG